MKKIFIIILTFYFGIVQAQKKQFRFPPNCIGTWIELNSLENVKKNSVWSITKVSPKPLPESYVKILINGKVNLYIKKTETTLEYKYFIEKENLNGKEILIFNPYGMCGSFKAFKFEIIEMSEKNIKLKCLN